MFGHPTEPRSDTGTNFSGHPVNQDRGVWRAKVNVNLSHIGWFKYRKIYRRELLVNYVVDAVSLNCGSER